MLSYTCPACGYKILARRSKIGDKVYCPGCGESHQIPKSAIASGPPEDPYSYSSNADTYAPNKYQPQAPTSPAEALRASTAKSAWDPVNFTLIAIPFTFVPVLVVAGLNWGRMGYPNKKTTLLLAAALLAPCLLVLFYASYQSGLTKMAWFATLIWSFVVSKWLIWSQLAPFDRFIKDGGYKSGLGKVILNSIAFVVVLFGVSVGVPHSYQKHRFAQLVTAYEELNAGHYQTAKRALDGIRDYYKDDYQLWTYYGHTYAFLGQLDSAGYAFQRAHQLNPDDPEIREAITDLYEKYGWHPKNGKLLTWYETGQKRLECTYSNGRRIGTAIRYYPDGSPDRIYNYQDGKLHGKFEIFYADHSKFAEGKCVHGELDGEVICWDPETKKPEVTSVYENGVLIRGVEFDTMYQRWYRK